MQILTKEGTRSINFIPSEAINMASNRGFDYNIIIKSEAQNKIILTDSNPFFVELDYYYVYYTEQALLENNYYTITITKITTVSGVSSTKILFKDKMYCTNQTLSDYQISNGVYIEQSTGDNNFIYYG